MTEHHIYNETREGFINYFREIFIPEKGIEVIIKPFRKKRSTESNSFYWGCVVTPLADHCGYSKEDMHTELLGIYYGWESREFRGHKRDFPRRTTTTPETAHSLDFQGLTQTGQQIAAELGVRLPDEE
jgi:hypothetical protein